MNSGRTEVITDEYFGGCPHCGKFDGYLNHNGPHHWSGCAAHRVKWYVGWNLFSSWQNETEEEQRRLWDDAGFDDFEIIRPIYPARGVA